MAKKESRKVLFVRDTFVDGELVEAGSFETLDKGDATQVVGSSKAVLVTGENEADLKKQAADIKKHKAARAAAPAAAAGVPAGYVKAEAVQGMVDAAVSAAVEKAVAAALAKPPTA